MSDDDQRVIDALMAAQRKNRKIIPCPECERLQSLLEAANEMEADREAALQEIERLRAALAKSCEEGRDEMYDCGYNRLRAALERIANAYKHDSVAGDMAREALEGER